MIYSAILRKGEEVYALLSMIFKAIEDKQLEYNFLINDVEAYPNDNELFEFLVSNDVWISGKELT
jgi:hypothetical protein